MKKIVLTLILFSVLSLIPLLHATAQEPEAAPACSSIKPSAELCNPVKPKDFKEFIFYVIQILTGFFLMVPVMRIAFAGFLLVTSQGNEESITAAKKTLQWTV